MRHRKSTIRVQDAILANNVGRKVLTQVAALPRIAQETPEHLVPYDERVKAAKLACAQRRERRVARESLS